jgi:hypothetical protein
MGTSPDIARGRDGKHRRRSVADDHRAREGQFLGTLIRHFLASPVLGLPSGVVKTPVVTLLVALIGGTAGALTLSRAAGTRAVALSSVATAAEVEDHGTVAATDLAQAVPVTMHWLSPPAIA